MFKKNVLFVIVVLGLLISSYIVTQIVAEEKVKAGVVTGISGQVDIFRVC